MFKFERFPNIEENRNVWRAVKQKFRRFFSWISVSKNKSPEAGKSSRICSFFMVFSEGVLRIIQR